MLARPSATLPESSLGRVGHHAESLAGIIVIAPPPSLASGKEGTACRAPTITEFPKTVFEDFGKPVAASLATIVRSFKSAVSKRVREELGAANLPVWQRSYFEHVIRDEDSLNKIRNYIWENPIHWNTDEYYLP